MPLVNVARLLAFLWLPLSIGVYFLMLNGFKPNQALILTPWVAAPLPLAFAMGAWLYWDAFLGPSSREESLSGLIVLVAPLYQIVVIGLALLVASMLNRSWR